MVQVHICVCYLLAVWVVLGMEVCRVEGEPFTPIHVDDLQLETQLKLVHVLFRHGDRTPDREEMELYPANPNIDNQFYPYGLKALTNEGKLREYNLGKILRNRYKDLLSSLYVPEEIHVRTTDFDRTKMSALACLAGLYPPTEEQQWHPHIMWQPIPYYTKAYEDDDMLYYYTCPRFLEARTDELESPKFQKMFEPYKELLKKLNHHTGRNISTPEEVFYLDNLFQAEKNYNLPPPGWAIPLMDQIKEVTVLEYKLQFATDELKRIGGGTLLQKMIKDSYAHIKGTLIPKERKMFLYSAHENNVAALLACSGVFEEHQPTFASTFILELHQEVKSKTHVFRILYLRETTKPLEVLSIPGCGEFCPFEKFVLLTKNTVTSSLKKDCMLKHS